MLQAAEWDSLIHEADKTGAEHGKAQADWLFPGNTSKETYEQYARWIANLDVSLWERYVDPLSGEYADMSVDRLFYMLSVNPDQLSEEEKDRVCLAYEEAHAAAWLVEVERLVNYQLMSG